MNKQQKKKPIKGSNKSLKAGKLLDKALSNSDRQPKIADPRRSTLFPYTEGTGMILGNERDNYQIQLGPNSILTLHNGNGCKSEYTGEELMTLFKIAEEKKTIERSLDISIEELKQSQLIAENAKRRIKELELENSGLQSVIIEFEKKLRDARNVIEIQGTDGNWNSEPYQFGFYNGMACIMSIFEGQGPKYRDNPFVIDGRETSPSEILTNLFSQIGNRFGIMPIIIQEVNTFLLEKLKNNAEEKLEEADFARKRFQESVEFIKSQLNFKP